MSLTFISLTTVVVTEVLEIKNPVLICITGGLLVAFPGITETFFFEYTADGYMIAMLLSALAVWLTKVEHLSIKRGILAAVCICASCAIYQAYVSFALILALCYFILKLLDDSISSKETWKWIGTQAAVYIGGLASYYILWKLLMKIGNYAPTSYQGIDSLSISIDTILKATVESVRTLIVLFFEWNVLEHGWTAYSILNLVFLLCAAVAVVCAVIKTKLYTRKVNLLLLIVSVSVIPFVACIWMFASQRAVYRPMMLISICLVYILTAVIYEKYFSKTAKNLFALLLAVMIFNNGLMANISYYYMNRSYFSSYATATEMISEIHDLNTESKKIAVAGNKWVTASLAFAPHTDRINLLGQLLKTDLLYMEEALVGFFNETFYEDFEASGGGWQSDEEIVEKVSEMECWPAESSIQVIGDTIFIKIQDED